MQTKKVVDVLSDLAVSIVKREHPFDSMPIYEEVCSKQYLYYMRYLHEMSSTLRQKVLDAEIDRVRYQIQKKIIGVEIPFAYKFPQHMKTRNEFWDWLKKQMLGTGSEEQGMMGQINLNVDFRKELVNAISTKMPLFQFFKNKKYRGFVCFEKNCENTRILLLADRGAKRSFISYLIGADQPHFIIDIALLFSGVQSAFWYSSKESLIQGVGRACDLLSIIMPHFENALGRIGRDHRDALNL